MSFIIFAPNKATTLDGGLIPRWTPGQPCRAFLPSKKAPSRQISWWSGRVRSRASVRQSKKVTH